MNPARRTVELAEPSLLATLRAKGYEIDQGEGVQEYLNRRGANAATFRNMDLLLRLDPRKVEVLEEYLHNVQERIGLSSRLTPSELERHVKNFMLRHRRLLGISPDDVEWLESWLKANP